VRRKPVSLLNYFVGNKTIPVVHPRQVNLSGTVLQFAMPEDFSRDMPADDLVEAVDINDLTQFNDPAYGQLMRRWWDIKAPGLFGKKLGTVMLEIAVNRVPENKRKKIHDKPYNPRDRLDLLLMVDEVLHQRYDELIEQTKNAENYLQYGIPSLGFLLGNKLQTESRNPIIDGKKWLSYSANAPYSQLIVGDILPLTDNTFLEFIYTYSPNNNILPREFRSVAYQKTQLIEDSIKVHYAKNNTIGELVSSTEWLNVTNDQVLEKHRDQLLVPMFGPDIYKELEDYKLNAKNLLNQSFDE
jgi:hypothetical protein